MKYLRRLVLTIVLLLSVVAVYASGIKDAKELVAFVTAINSGSDISDFRNEQGVICLEADIDMAKVKKLPSIKSFGGIFDGQGHALKNWTAQRPLFYEILEGGKVCNLRIDASCSMKAQNKDDEDYCLGWIAGINSGEIVDCENYAPINHKSTFTEHNLSIGGIVGLNRYVVYRCKNYGDITSICSASAANGSVLRMGGIVGSGQKNPIPCSSIIRCENYGAVTYKGDMQHDKIGGIVGEHFGARIRTCVNRNNISSTSSVSENGKSGFSYVAGISAGGNADVMCCDNFGNISSTGSHKAYVAGVFAIAYGRFVIGDCKNYGNVEATNDLPSTIGGIVGVTGFGAHITNGVNYGHIRYAGTSANDASYNGGIIGNIYTYRKTRLNAYLRRCVNYGKVESLSGGNNYDNHDKSIHTGGIVGRSTGAPGRIVCIHDCANKGEVTAITGRRGNIAGFISDTRVTGEYFDNNYAASVEPKSDGSNIYGRVTNNLGEAVVGCVVSDGTQCVTTDNDGYYAMRCDIENTRFVFISIPDGYKIPHRKSVVQNFRRIPRYVKAVEANFTLEKRTEPTDKYTVIMIGDPQMRGLGSDNSGERYRDELLPDIEEFKKTREGEFFAIALGDVVYNWMPGYDDYLDINADLSFPVANLIGNHDYCQTTLYETELGAAYYEEYITPTYYSFTIGKTHYVIARTIIYSRQNHKHSYGAGLEDKQMKWLEEDLKHVPKDYTIYICGHAQLFKRKSGNSEWTHGIPLRNYARYSELLKQYKKVYSWAGHYHENYCYSYAGNKEDRFAGFENITCVAVARAIGDLRTNLKTMSDGEENGYMVVDVDGEDFTWWYKSIGRDKNYQMRPYTPTVTGDGYLKVNIWNYTKATWSPVEWWENGVKVGEFEKHKDTDLNYLKLIEEEKAKNPKSNLKPNPKSDYMFRIKPSEGVRSGEIRVTDNFGVTYTETVEW